jgi:hypothetical protein
MLAVSIGPSTGDDLIIVDTRYVGTDSLMVLQMAMASEPTSISRRHGDHLSILWAELGLPFDASVNLACANQANMST